MRISAAACGEGCRRHAPDAGTRAVLSLQSDPATLDKIKPFSFNEGDGASEERLVTLMKFHGAISLGVSLMLLAAPAHALTPEEIAAVRAQIEAFSARAEAARASVSGRETSLIGALALARAETLELARAILEARLAAEESGASLEITLPVAEPDLERAAEIAEQISRQEEIVAEAESEAETAGGLLQAMALSRVEAEKLTLARLRAALMEARYGAILPVEVEPVTMGSAPTPDEAADEDMSDPSVAWADPDYPEIDYTQSTFAQLDKEGFEIAGWWGIKKDRAAVDDSPMVFSLNVSQFPGAGTLGDYVGLQVNCREGRASVIYDTDDYLLTDVRASGIDVTVRVDDAPARTERWSQLTSGEGAGLFGARGEAFIRELYDANRLFLRIIERDGESHDATFELAGVQTVVAAAAKACEFSTLELGRDDYRAIQEMLNAGGFDAGTPDGVWGPGSKAALRRFQDANGLELTGTPNRETLAAMGLDL